MSFERHTRTPVPLDEQCGHLTTICRCEHGMHAHLSGGCVKCDCAGFESRPCRFRKGKCSAEIKMTRRRESERQIEPPSAQQIDEWQTEVDAERGIDPRLCGVYFIQCRDFIKIGKTINLRQRLIAHQLSTPFDLAIAGFVQCLSYELDEMEGRFHRRFSDLHHRGEWFRLEGALESFINEIRPENEKAPSVSTAS